VKKIDNVTQSDTRALLLSGLGVLGFSGTLPATRLAVPHLGVVQVGLGRALLAAVCAALVLLGSRAALPSRAQCTRLLVVALGVVVGFPWLSGWALTRMPASRASLVVALTPLLTAALSVLRDKARPPLRFWLGSGLGTACVMVYLAVSAGEQTAAAGSSMLPEMALLLATLCAAVGYHEGARLSVEMGGVRVISWALVLAVPLVLPIVLSQPLPFSQSLPSKDVPYSAWLGFGYVSLISMYGAFFFWYNGLSRAGVARASQVQLMQPLLSLAWAGIFVGEELSPWLFLTGVAVLGSMSVAVRSSVGSRPARPAHLAQGKVNHPATGHSAQRADLKRRLTPYVVSVTEQTRR